MEACCSSRRREALEDAEDHAETALIDRDEEYVDCNALNSIRQLESSIWWSSVVWWVILPLGVITLNFTLESHFSHNTCGAGVGRYAAIPIALAVLHLLWSESCAWACLRSLLAPPEWTIMRQLGILRLRAFCVLFGLLEGLDLFTDVMFPFIAKACDEELTPRWLRAWSQVPYLGLKESEVLNSVRFWGVALVLVLLNLAFGGLGSLRVIRQEEEGVREQLMLRTAWTSPRIEAQVFYAWARASTSAMLLSVTVLCEAMADQRRWVFDERKAGSAASATALRQELAFNKVLPEQILAAAVTNTEVHRRVAEEREAYHTRTLVVKVILGNVLSMWMQSSYFALTFEQQSHLAHKQVVASMMISAFTMLVRIFRLRDAMRGWPGRLLFLLVIAVLSWTGAKVYNAYQCPDHIWNLTSGCVELPRRA